MDDIQFLSKNHRKEECVLFVDSSTRNKAIYPTPSEYSIQLDDPFKFVYGIDIVDAIVPKTMYNVDAHTNQATFIVDDTHYHVTVEPLNYSFETLQSALKDNLKSLNIDVVARLDGRYTFRNNKPFAIDLGTSSMREVLGFDEPLLHGDVAYSNFEKTNTLELNFDNNTHIFNIDSYAFVRQRFVVEEDGVLSTIKTANPDLDIYVDIYCGSELIASHVKVNSEIDNISLHAHRQYEFVWANPVPEDAVFPGTSTILLVNKISLATGSHTLTTPGIVNLLGERFVVVRCKETEEHSNRSLSGLALIKLGTTGYADVKAEFNSLKSKTFFPIGKLNRLSFRFERLGGKLYDFKGVNHTLIIAVKYMIPHVDISFQSELNPNYNPDTLTYYKISADNETGELEVRDEDDAFFDERYDDVSDADGSASEISFNSLE